MAYDVRLLVHDGQPSGIPLYARELIKSVARHMDVVLLVDRPWSPSVPGRVETVPSRWGWQQLHLPCAIRRLRPSVFHGLQFTLPIMARGPKVVTVHDMAFCQVPEVVEPKTRAFLRRWVPRSIRVASQVIVPSQSVRSEVIERFHLSPGRVALVPYGVGPPFTLSPDAREESPYPWPYVLAVGTVEPRKNLPRLVQAFERVVRRTPDIPHHLVLVGRPGGDEPRIRALIAANHMDDRVELAGYVPQIQLARLYRHASLFAYTSLYEGFGLPLLEAMVSRCPVLTSNSSAMPEVVGEFGALVDPLSVESMAWAIERTIVNGVADHCLSAAAAHARRFSWELTAKGTLEAYRDAM